MSEEIILASVDFLIIFLGSIIIGAVFVLAIAYLLKRQAAGRKPAQNSASADANAIKSSA